VRTLIALLVAAVVLLIPGAGAAQTPQLQPASIVFTGSRYYSSGPTVFFDGSVMVRVGTYEGVPIYLNPTRDPINVVYLPISGKLMRPYARSREEQAADVVVPPPTPAPVVTLESAAEVAEPIEVDIPNRAVVVEPPPPASPPLAPWREGPASRGIWIEFDGKTWTPSGRVNNVPGRGRDSGFEVIGRYFDFPVYQERGQRDRIFVPSMPGGPLIRYDLRRP
jgi:hypothetical protein